MGILQDLWRVTGVQGEQYENHKPIPNNKALCDMLCAAMSQERGAEVGAFGALIFKGKGNIARNSIGFELDGHTPKIENAQVETVVYQNRRGEIEWPMKGLDEGFFLKDVGKIQDIRFMTTVRDDKGQIVSEHVMTDWHQYIRRFKDGKPYRIEMITPDTWGVQPTFVEEKLRLPFIPHDEIHRFELAEDGKTVTRRSWIRQFETSHCDLDKGKVIKSTYVKHVSDSLGDGWPIYSKQIEYHSDGSQTVVTETRDIDSCHTQTPDKRVIKQIKPNGDQTVTTQLKYGKPTVEYLDKDGRVIGADIRWAKHDDRKMRSKYAEAIKESRRKKSNLFQRLGLQTTGRQDALDLAKEYHQLRSEKKEGKTALKFRTPKNSGRG